MKEEEIDKQLEAIKRYGISYNIDFKKHNKTLIVEVYTANKVQYSPQDQILLYPPQDPMLLKFNFLQVEKLKNWKMITDHITDYFEEKHLGMIPIINKLFLESWYPSNRRKMATICFIVMRDIYHLPINPRNFWPIPKKKTIKKIRSSLHINKCDIKTEPPPSCISIEKAIYYYAEKLKLSKKTINEILKLHKSTNYYPTNPISYISGIIYLGSILAGEHIPQREVAYATRETEETIRNAKRKIINSLKDEELKKKFQKSWRHKI